jgi:hypothetical protein
MAFKSRAHYANTQRKEFAKLGRKRKEIIVETASVLKISPEAVHEYFVTQNQEFLEERE